MPRYLVNKVFVEASRRDHHIEIKMRWRYPLRFLQGFLCLGLWYLLYTLDPNLVESKNLRPLVTYSWVISVFFGPIAAVLLLGIHITPVFADPWSSRTCLLIEIFGDIFCFLGWVLDCIFTGILLGSVCDPKASSRPIGCDRMVTLIAFQVTSAFLWLISSSVSVHGYFKKFVWEQEDHEATQHAETMATIRRMNKNPASYIEGGGMPISGGRSRRGSMGSSILVSGVAGSCKIRSRSPSLMGKLDETPKSNLKKSESTTSMNMPSFQPIKRVNSTASSGSLAGGMGSRVNSGANLLMPASKLGSTYALGSLKKSGSSSSVSNLTKKGGQSRILKPF
ncbi:hypothetical protein HDU97_009371 [Phlyctochytrium planicorne]|nr:hypothetical protein HDU97_009371 [Phlyctochytrium planicorne]